MEKLLPQLDIETFRNNIYVNKVEERGKNFIRKGIIGDWKNHFDEEMNSQWDPWIEKQLKGSSFQMQFE
jgi:hypothetical protein